MVVGNSNIFASNAVPSTQAANAPSLINSMPLSLKLVQISHSPTVTPVKVDRLQYLSHGHPAFLQQHLVSVFSRDCLIHFEREWHAFKSPNLKSALEQPRIVVSKLKEEHDAGRIVGPFHEPRFSRHSSQEGSLEFHLIHHLSYPPGSSVNDFIPEDCSSVHYASINDAISVMKWIGAGCFMVNPGVKSAF